MGNSPKDTKNGDSSKSPVQSNGSPPQADPAASKPDETVKNESTTKAEPLAPPPRPEPAVGSTPDYFSVAHPGSHLATEANPFEFSFAGGQNGASGAGDQTPGGTKLPSVAALTSPAGILGSGQTPNFWGSLRSGPLSPAMLSGPQKDDYFSDGHHLRGGFPTPNESGLRSGLTPGGGGSMFPEPSPNTQALFSSLASGGATPTTLDFHRTAMNAAAANRQHQGSQNVTSQPQDISSINVRPPVAGQFEGNDANDAANGLFLLAQSQTGVRNGSQQTNHYTSAPPMAVHSHTQSVMSMGGNSHETSPTMANRNNGSISTTSGRGVSEMSDDNNEQPSRPNTRGKGKRASTQISNGQKATPSKGPANKKSKNNNGHSMAMEPEPQMSEEEQDLSKDEYNAQGKKMTDEEKRKNFLERNRVAALKCRQRKKQWLANLQQKVEIFSTENDALSQQIGALREELVNLKTLLLAHKDCPVTAQQGLGPMVHQLQIDGYGQQMSHNPYGMAGMPQGVMNGPGMTQQRRYS